MFRNVVYCLMAALYMVAILPSAAPADESSNPTPPPEILWNPCSFTSSVRVGQITNALPGHSYHIPIDLLLESGYSAYHITIKVEFDAGLSYDSFTPVGWTGYIDHTQDHSIHTFDFYGDFSLAGNNNYQTLLDLNLTINGDVDFGTTMNLGLPGDTDFPSIQWIKNGTFCYTGKEPGSVKTIYGEYRFELGTVEGNSYQARHLVDPKQDMYILVPIYFKANYPVDHLKTYLNIDFDQFTGGGYRGFDADPLFPGVSVQQVLGNHYYIEYSGFIESSSTYYHLGDLKFWGIDYGNYYNTDLGFSSQMAMQFEIPLFLDMEVRCAGSQTAKGWVDFWHIDGSVEYPVYACTTTFVSMDVDVYNGNSVSMPVNAKHSFWAEPFNYYVNFNTSKLTYDNVEDAGGDIPTVSASEQYDGTIWVYTDDSFNPWTFIAPHSSNKIFNMLFTPSSQFLNIMGDTCYVGLSSSYSSYVEDYFHDQFGKISRSLDPLHPEYFKVYPAIISSPWARVNIGEEIAVWDGRYYIGSVPVVLEDIKGDNDFQSYKFDFTVEDGPFQFFGITDGDLNIQWNAPLITEGRTKIEVKGTSTEGAVNGPGTLFNLIMKSSIIWTSTIGNDSSLFLYWTQIGNKLITKHAIPIDGSIEAQGRGKRSGDDGEIPFYYNLNQNYPNPFNANTIIEFGVAEPGFVNIEVYDILGKKVRTLKAQDMEPGIYQVVWNGRNDAGAEVGSGYYFYILQTDNFTDKKRMTLLK